MAPFPCVLQWLSDNMVLPKIAEDGLIRLCSYSMKTFAASKLMTPISNGNNTSSKMAKATNLYCSPPNLPSSTFFFIRASMTFLLKPPSAILHWLIFPRPNNLTTSEVMSSNLRMR